MNSGSRVPQPHVVVLFGARGDLAARKLIPGFFHLAHAGLMPQHYRIVGTSRRDMTDEEFREHARESIVEFGAWSASGEVWERFAGSLSYVASDASDLSAVVAEVDRASDAIGDARILNYLSIPPAAMAGVVTALGESPLSGSNSKVIMEKPFGTDLESARHLNHLVSEAFAEDQIFRIDHFLGKEDVQNILAVRFSNRLFEPVWNSDHVSHLQIDVPETLGVENRAAFFEQTGAFRDMVVTHLFQVLGYVGMDAPSGFDADGMGSAKFDVFSALEPLDPKRVVRGQYSGYRGLDEVADDSDTETLVALETRIDNERWDGVPIYLRHGKRMPEGRRVVTVVLKEPSMAMFSEHLGASRATIGDKLVFEIGEPGGIVINFQTKEPGPSMLLGPAQLEFDYKSDFDPRCELEAYQRLLHDAMLGDHTLFTRAEGIERLWEVAAPLLAAPPPVELYEPGTWGPPSVDALITPNVWHLPDSQGDTP